MADCCMDGNFCDFPWCDCTGNAEYRRVNNITDPSKPLVWDEAKRNWKQEHTPPTDDVPVELR